MQFLFIESQLHMSYEETDFVSFTHLNKMVQQMMLHSASIARAKNRSRIYQITQGHNMWEDGDSTPQTAQHICSWLTVYLFKPQNLLFLYAVVMHGSLHATILFNHTRHSLIFRKIKIFLSIPNELQHSNANSGWTITISQVSGTQDVRQWVCQLVATAHTVDLARQ